MKRSKSRRRSNPPAWALEVVSDLPSLVPLALAADFLHLSPRTLQDWHRSGRLVALKTTAGPGTGRVLISRAELARLVASMADPCRDYEDE